VRHGGLTQVIFDSEIAEDFGGSLIGDVRARRVGCAGIFRDPDRLDASAGQKSRGGQPGRSGPNHQHVGLEHFHGFLPSMLSARV